MDEPTVARDEEAVDAAQQEPIRCRACGSVIADALAVCSIGGERPLRVQVNPHGVAFEVLTLGRAEGLELVGPATAEHSWFSGWAWTIAVCVACGQHLGWRFDATNGASPPRFWGLIAGQLSGI